MPETMQQALSQDERNQALLARSTYMKDEVVSHALPWRIHINRKKKLNAQDLLLHEALQIDAARIAIESVGSLANINEVDHLGGGLDMIPALLLTLAFVDYDAVEFTLENAHASIGYYAALAALGFLDRSDVVDTFRRSLDIPGHVSWVPGGTQLNGGRLGVMIPAAVGQALGKKARHGDKAWVICHCGDAGWISGQALNGFNAADLHGAPTTFVMHRNGIQLSGTNRDIMDKDPRPILASLGVEILETPSLHDASTLYTAYREARALAKQGRPSLVYPVGEEAMDLVSFAQSWGIEKEMAAFAAEHNVPMNSKVWVPGALMSFRDVVPMLECLFLVNDLPGGAAHHDGHLKGREVDEVLSNPMLQFSNEQEAALQKCAGEEKRDVVTRARPAPGSPNLILSKSNMNGVELPGVGKRTSARAGVQPAYEALALAFPHEMFVIDCDLAPSTKTDKAKAVLTPDHTFELSIEEQVAAIIANGLAMSTHDPQLVVFATFGAFFEGIAREGMEMWRYQRNLNGINEGLNVTYHMSHVGACTGRDHFSGWALDWINVGITSLPYLHRFYAPADARAAYGAIRDLAAHYGGHMIGIPRDNLPILAKQDGSGALWEATSVWDPLTTYRVHEGAQKAILAFGAPAFLAGEASDELLEEGNLVDVHIVNGLPLDPGQLKELLKQYPDGVVTIEDGIIDTRPNGLRGFAGIVYGAAYATGTPLAHIGIEDPRIAPSEGHMEVWEHFGITKEALVAAVRALG